MGRGDFSSFINVSNEELEERVLFLSIKALSSSLEKHLLLMPSKGYRGILREQSELDGKIWEEAEKRSSVPLSLFHSPIQPHK